MTPSTMERYRISQWGNLKPSCISSCAVMQCFYPVLLRCSPRNIIFALFTLCGVMLIYLFFLWISDVFKFKWIHASHRANAGYFYLLTFSWLLIWYILSDRIASLCYPIWVHTLSIINYHSSILHALYKEAEWHGLTGRGTLGERR